MNILPTEPNRFLMCFLARRKQVQAIEGENGGVSGLTTG